MTGLSITEILLFGFLGNLVQNCGIFSELVLVVIDLKDVLS